MGYLWSACGFVLIILIKVEVEEPNPGGGVTIRRKGWLAVSFKIKIEKEQKQGGSLIAREEGEGKGSNALGGNHSGWIQGRRIPLKGSYHKKNLSPKPHI